MGFVLKCGGETEEGRGSCEPGLLRRLCRIRMKWKMVPWWPVSRLGLRAGEMPRDRGPCLWEHDSIHMLSFVFIQFYPFSLLHRGHSSRWPQYLHT